MQMICQSYLRICYLMIYKFWGGGNCDMSITIIFIFYLLQFNICDWNNINDLNTDMYIRRLRNIFFEKILGTW